MTCNFLCILAVLVVQCFCSHLTVHQVIRAWKPYIMDQVEPYQETGITREMMDEVASSGSHVTLIYTGGKLHVYDPKGFCVCNRSVYGHSSIFLDHLRNCRAFVQLAQTAITFAPISDFEMAISLDDFPMHYSVRTKNASARNWDQYVKSKSLLPGFGAFRCWQRGGFAIPFFASHVPWDIATHDSTIPRFDRPVGNLRSKKGAVVHRGWYRGCSHERNTVIDLEFYRDFNATAENCGRKLLHEVADRYPDLIDYKASWMSMKTQEQEFRYTLAVEGFAGWTNKINIMPFGDSVMMVQQFPCQQWFEPMWRPYTHYIPVAHDFRDLPGQVLWANANLRTATEILRNNRKFAGDFLLRDGITGYMYTLLSQYASLIRYKVVVPATGTISPEDLNTYAKTVAFCAALPAEPAKNAK